MEVESRLLPFLPQIHLEIFSYVLDVLKVPVVFLENQRRCQHLLAVLSVGSCSTLKRVPDNVKIITADASLTTEKFLRAGLDEVLRMICASMQLQVATQMAERVIYLAGDPLGAPDRQGDDNDQEEIPGTILSEELDRVLPFYDWQGSSKKHARVQYIMVLLESATQAPWVSLEQLAKSLTTDENAKIAARPFLEYAPDHPLQLARICGE